MRAGEFQIFTEWMRWPLLAVAAGAFSALFIWLWSSYGLDVVLAYAAGIAMQCF